MITQPPAVVILGYRDGRIEKQKSGRHYRIKKTQRYQITENPQSYRDNTTGLQRANGITERHANYKDDDMID